MCPGNPYQVETLFLLGKKKCAQLAVRKIVLRTLLAREKFASELLFYRYIEFL